MLETLNYESPTSPKANDWDAVDDEEPEAQPLAAAVAVAVAGAGGL